MGKEKVERSAGGKGYCCAHCADSKYPCVNMEKVLRAGEEKEKAGGTKNENR